MIILEVQGSVIVVVMRTVILRFLFLLAASRALGCEIEIKNGHVKFFWFGKGLT